MWPFGRRKDQEEAEPDAAGEAADPGDGADAADSAPTVGVQRAPLGPPAWSRLPVIQRVVTDAPLTAPRSRLVEGLSSWKSPAATLAPLGHAVTDDAPVGVVGATATGVLDPPTGDIEHPPPSPRDSALPGLDLRVQRVQASTRGLTRVPSWMARTAPLTPVQRSVEAPTNMIDAPAPEVPPLTLPKVELITPPAESESERQDAAPGSRGAPTAPLVGGEPPPPAGVQRSVATSAGDLDLPLVPPSPGAPAEARDEPAAPAPPATESAVQRSTAPDVPLAETPTAPLLGTETPPAGGDLPTPPAPIVQRRTDEGDSPGQGDLPLQQQPKPTVQRRPRGLGAPIGHAPPSATPAPVAPSEPATPIQREQTPTPAPPPGPAPTVPLIGEPPPLGPPSADTPAESPMTPPAAVLDLPLVQRSPVDVEPAEAGAPEAVPEAPRPEPPTTQTAPLLGDAPTPAAAAAGEAESPEPASPAPPLPLAGPTAVQRAALDATGVADEGAVPATTETAPLIGDAPSPSATTPQAPSTQAGPTGAAPSPAHDAPDAGPIPTSPDLPLAAPAPPSVGVQRHAMSIADFAAASASTDHDQTETEAKGPGVVQRSTIGAPGTAPAPTTAATPALASGSPPRPPLPIAPLLSGRPFEVSPIQRQRDGTPTPTSAMTQPAGPGSVPTAATASPHPELSSAPGVYDPVLPLALWSGAAAPADRLTETAGAEAVAPGDVVTAVQRATGHLLEAPRLRRDTGPFVQRMGARALAQDGTAHVPHELGSLDTPANRGLVAHELTHVAQRQALGGAVPAEDSPLGLALEGQARAVESAVTVGLTPPRVSPAGTPAPPAPPAPLPPMPLPSVQRAATESGPGPSPFTPDQLSTLLSLAQNPPTSGPTSVSVQRETTGSEAASSAPTAPAGTETPTNAVQDLDDDELAARLYPRFRARLRRELRSDRERLGRPTDV